MLRRHRRRHCPIWDPDSTKIGKPLIPNEKTRDGDVIRWGERNHIRTIASDKGATEPARIERWGVGGGQETKSFTIPLFLLSRWS